MALSTFAERFHLNLRRAEDDTFVVVGRHGQLYEYSDNELGILIMPAASKVRYWGHARKAMIAAGMTIRQNGDHEGAVSFAPHNKKAARLAIKLVGARPKRIPSVPQLLALAKARLFIPAPGLAPAAR